MKNSFEKDYELFSNFIQNKIIMTQVVIGISITVSIIAIGVIAFFIVKNYLKNKGK